MRYSRRPTAFTRSPSLVRPLMLLLLVGFLYYQARDPNNWRFLARQDEDAAPAAPPVENKPAAPPAKWKEAVVPNPTDHDFEEREAIQHQFQAVFDHEPMAAIDMPAYWRLFKWARAQSMAELEKRARTDVTFAELFDRKADLRGELIRLRLHIKRVNKPYTAVENSAGVKKVYEIWGWTEDSKSYPYCVLTSELPPGFKRGDDIHEEGVFCGYFLKWMKYDAFDKSRSTPVLIGRIRKLKTDGDSRAAAPAAAPLGDWWLWAGAGGILALAAWFRFRESRRMQASTVAARVSQDELAEWLQTSDDAKPA